eukprot:gb/GEZN01011050.1/.p1 GENE.gb/GEZN01011050.1/~~gb/GEZN01011050.1/.p1  ORF type:complete len:157 (+),score=28.06 gb/GEZN01011050.1/:217-687(+)
MDSKEVEQIRVLGRDSEMRFSLELEFVEMLASPWFLQALAQQKHFDDPAFINYLHYLQYWKKPPYLKYIRHAHALYFLELVLKPEFCKQLLHPEYVNMIHTNQYWHWHSYRYLRALEKEERLRVVAPDTLAAAKAAAEQPKTPQITGAKRKNPLSQ